MRRLYLHHRVASRHVTLHHCSAYSIDGLCGEKKQLKKKKSAFRACWHARKALTYQTFHEYRKCQFQWSSLWDRMHLISPFQYILVWYHFFGYSVLILQLFIFSTVPFWEHGILFCDRWEQDKKIHLFLILFDNSNAWRVFSVSIASNEVVTISYCLCSQERVF